MVKVGAEYFFNESHLSAEPVNEEVLREIIQEIKSEVEKL